MEKMLFTARELDLVARKAADLKPLFSTVFSALGALSSYLLVLFLVEQFPLSLTCILLALFFIIAGAVPAIGWLRSKAISKEEIANISANLRISANQTPKIRKKLSGDPTTYDAGLFRFISVSEYDLERIKSKPQNRQLAKVTHELGHLKNRDPLRLSLYVYLVVVVVVCFAMFFLTIVSDEALLSSGLTTVLSPIGIVLTAPYLLAAIVVFFSLGQFIHDREFSADAVAFALLGDRYKIFLTEAATIEQLQVSKSRLTRVWNRLLHPSFDRRQSRVNRRSKPDLPAFVFCFLQAYITIFVILFFWLFLDWRFSFILSSGWPYWTPYIAILPILFGIGYVFGIAIGFSRQIRSSSCSKLKLLILLSFSVAIIFLPDRLLLGWVLDELLLNKNPGSDATMVLEWLYNEIQVFSVSTSIGFVFLLLLTTRIVPSQLFLPGGLSFLQDINGAIFVIRMLLFAVLELLSIEEIPADAYLLAFGYWIAGEFLVETLRLLRCKFLGMTPVKIFDRWALWLVESKSK